MNMEDQNKLDDIIFQNDEYDQWVTDQMEEYKKLELWVGKKK